MTLEEYYGEAFQKLQLAEQYLLKLIRQYPERVVEDGTQPILYCKSRIKKPESMIRKLKKQGLPLDSVTALKEMHDAVGVRIVCSFTEDVYEVSRWLYQRREIRILKEKDYISFPKPNGYRSLHLILEFTGPEITDLRAEIQLRTIALDFWAALEHQIKYKRQIRHEKLIEEELKRCADEIASVDMSMQTLRDLLRGDSPFW